MDVENNCTVFNLKLDVVNYLKHRTVCKICYNKNRRKRNNTSHHTQKSKVLINITIIITPQKPEEILEFPKKSKKLKVLELRIPRSTRT